MEKESNKQKNPVTLEKAVSFDVVKILEDTKIDDLGKIKTIEKSGDAGQKSLAKHILNFKEVKEPKQQKTHYDKLLAIFKEEDFEKFSIYMAMLSIAYDSKHFEHFEDVNMFRMLDKWTWGEKALSTNRNIQVMMLSLSNPRKRKEQRNTISIEKVLESPSLNSKMKDNLSRYFN